MRDIKFRAWVNGSGIPKMIEHEEIDAIEWCNDKLWYRNGRSVLLGNLVLMQYTGIKDKTRNRRFPEGKEMYEGDIFEWADLRGEIIFKDGCFVFQCSGIGMTMRDHESAEYKIIGNIHEHPNLLNREQEDERSVATDVDSSNGDDKQK